MPKITKILENQGRNNDRVHIFIDNQFCTSVRKRTWIGMNSKIGSDINCEKLKKLENNFWKKLYGPSSWKREKVRINRVIQWFKKYIPEIEIVTIGLGADTNDYIYDIHSREKGAPDLTT